MHFKNALNAFIYTVFRAFFTQSLAKFRIYEIQELLRNHLSIFSNKERYCS